MAIWSQNGFAKFQQWMISIGETTCHIEGRTFESYPAASRDDQIYIAGAAFRTAKVYWGYAKEEHDLQVAEDRRLQQRSSVQAEQLNKLRTLVAAEKSLQALEQKQAAIRDQLSTSDGETAYVHQQLDIVQLRLIEIEKANGKRSDRLGVGGIVVGIIALLWARPSRLLT